MLSVFYINDMRQALHGLSTGRRALGLTLRACHLFRESSLPGMLSKAGFGFMTKRKRLASIAGILSLPYQHRGTRPRFSRTLETTTLTVKSCVAIWRNRPVARFFTAKTSGIVSFAQL
ncbi:hypothetical protein JDN40_11770 [Rhodomicrobium vannielii ATCC 17100]|uniref:hypothetical protein n=1 Tax=Rhodomicrobium vannielii TaxID=1069 RepID=UPI00191B01DF|nr:hypothetical protein [Rhodomicrobium vannielii]MBJ7534784.1 hypothetical protein [Rhodomicrobium vannielii ATCC 17100]